LAHDFKNFPELTNNQMAIYYFDSPHKQITEDFRAKVVKVSDGDTIKVITDFRDFAFKVRLAKIAAPELNEEGGRESQQWLEKMIMGKDVDILIDPYNRVGKWGRIIGEILSGGFNVNEMAIIEGKAVDFENRRQSRLLDIDMELKQHDIKI
jgi:endonuclease YncB( thermonuclease family)